MRRWEAFSFGLSQQPAEAGGSLIRETPGGGGGGGGSSPDNDGTGRYCQTARVRQARRRDVRMQELVVETPKATRRLEPGGSGPVSSARSSVWRATRCQVFAPPASRPRGRSAAYPWRDCRGIAGRRSRQAVHSERGNRPETPFPPACWAGGGKARRRLMVSGRGGALVVVRGRESRPQGEGGQRVRSYGTGMLGGRR